MELEQIPATAIPCDITDEHEKKAARLKLLPPQFLSNIGSFYALAERQDIASEMFKAALGACMRMSENGEEDMDIDALITTISFNLGRSYELRGVSSCMGSPPTGAYPSVQRWM